jgi:hypothetical protein
MRCLGAVVRGLLGDDALGSIGDRRNAHKGDEQAGTEQCATKVMGAGLTITRATARSRAPGRTIRCVFGAPGIAIFAGTGAGAAARRASVSIWSL